MYCTYIKNFYCNYFTSWKYVALLLRYHPKYLFLLLAVLTHLLLPSAEQQDKAGMLFSPATQHCTMLINRSCLGYVRRLVWAPWDLSQFPPNQICEEHAQTHGSVCWDHMPANVLGFVHASSSHITQV
jgi:hypothetical protein